jgi:RNA polymerase sigma-32 factor
MRSMKQAQSEVSPYVDFIRKSYKPLNKEEEYKVAKLYKSTRRKAYMHKLVCANLMHVVRMAYFYKSYRVDMQDLIQQGNIGLIKACEKYNPDKGFRFGTYALYWVKAYMLNFVIKNSHMIKKYAGTRHSRVLFFKLGQISDLIDTKDPAERDRKRKELATKAKLRVEHVIDMENRYMLQEHSTDDVVKEGIDERTVKDLLVANVDIEQETISQDQRSKIAEEVIEAMKNMLNEREFDIIQSRFGLDDEEPQTLNQLGKKYKISRERVRQVAEGSMIKMKAFMHDSDVVQEVVEV